MRVMAINASSVTMPMLFGVAGTVIGISGVFWITGAIVAGGTRLAFGLSAPARMRQATGDRRP
jgi:low temperature requirement protein LtrA